MAVHIQESRCISTIMSLRKVEEVEARKKRERNEWCGRRVRTHAFMHGNAWIFFAYIQWNGWKSPEYERWMCGYYCYRFVVTSRVVACEHVELRTHTYALSNVFILSLSNNLRPLTWFHFVVSFCCCCFLMVYQMHKRVSVCILYLKYYYIYVIFCMYTYFYMYQHAIHIQNILQANC